jgi:hypothetical protein
MYDCKEEHFKDGNREKYIIVKKQTDSPNNLILDAEF